MGRYFGNTLRLCFECLAYLNLEACSVCSAEQYSQLRVIMTSCIVCNLTTIIVMLLNMIYFCRPVHLGRLDISQH